MKNKKHKNKKGKKHSKKHSKEKMPSPEQMAYIAELAKEKEDANKKNEPWVGIVSLDVDYDNLDSGNFELDWNEHFIAKLLRAGYQGKVDHDIVDQWFNNVCRHIVLETYEQVQADPTHRGSIATELEDGYKEYK